MNELTRVRSGSINTAYDTVVNCVHDLLGSGSRKCNECPDKKTAEAGFVIAASSPKNETVGESYRSLLLLIVVRKSHAGLVEP